MPPAIQATVVCNENGERSHILIKTGIDPHVKGRDYNHKLDLIDNLDRAICEYAVYLGWNDTGNMRMLCACINSTTRVGILFRGTVSGEYNPKNLDDYMSNSE